MVLSGDALAATEPLISTLRDPDVLSSIYALGGLRPFLHWLGRNADLSGAYPVKPVVGAWHRLP